MGYIIWYIIVYYRGIVYMNFFIHTTPFSAQGFGKNRPTPVLGGGGYCRHNEKNSSVDTSVAARPPVYQLQP